MASRQGSIPGRRGMWGGHRASWLAGRQDTHTPASSCHPRATSRGSRPAGARGRRPRRLAPSQPPGQQDPGAQGTGDAGPSQGPRPRGRSSRLPHTPRREALASGCGQAADGPARSAVRPAQSQQRIHSPGQGRAGAPGRTSGPCRLLAKAGTRPRRPEAGGCPAWPSQEGKVPCPAQPKTQPDSLL